MREGVAARCQWKLAPEERSRAAGLTGAKSPRTWISVGTAEATDAYASAPTTIKISRERFNSAPILQRTSYPSSWVRAQRCDRRAEASRRYMLLRHST